MKFGLVLRREDLDDSKLRVKCFGRYITVMWCKQSSQISKQMILLHSYIMLALVYLWMK